MVPKVILDTKVLKTLDKKQNSCTYLRLGLLTIFVLCRSLLNVFPVTLKLFSKSFKFIIYTCLYIVFLVFFVFSLIIVKFKYSNEDFEVHSNYGMFSKQN